jgi:hypothetical protein
MFFKFGEIFFNKTIFSLKICISESFSQKTSVAFLNLNSSESSYNLSYLLFGHSYPYHFLNIEYKHDLLDEYSFQHIINVHDMGFTFYISFITLYVYDDVKMTISSKATSDHLLIKNSCCVIIYIISYVYCIDRLARFCSILLMRP